LPLATSIYERDFNLMAAVAASEILAAEVRLRLQSFLQRHDGVEHAGIQGRRDFRLPRDLSIIGFDDIAVAALADPSSDTIFSPSPEDWNKRWTREGDNVAPGRRWGLALDSYYLYCQRDDAPPPRLNNRVLQEIGLIPPRQSRVWQPPKNQRPVRVDQNFPFFGPDLVDMVGKQGVTY